MRGMLMARIVSKNEEIVEKLRILAMEWSRIDGEGTDWTSGNIDWPIAIQF